MKNNKKIILQSLSTLMAVFAMSSCGSSHTHVLTLVEAKDPTCTEGGNVAYYSCSGCDELFSDSEGKNVIENVTISAKGHTKVEHKLVPATCTEDGVIEYYECSACNKTFSDEEMKNEITDLTIPATGHDLTLVEAKEATCSTKGNIEYYSCSYCNEYFTDELGQNKISKDEVQTDFDTNNHGKIIEKENKYVCVDCGNEVQNFKNFNVMNDTVTYWSEDSSLNKTEEGGFHFAPISNRCVSKITYHLWADEETDATLYANVSALANGSWEVPFKNSFDVKINDTFISSDTIIHEFDDPDRASSRFFDFMYEDVGAIHLNKGTNVIEFTSKKAEGVNFKDLALLNTSAEVRFLTTCELNGHAYENDLVIEGGKTEYNQNDLFTLDNMKIYKKCANCDYKEEIAIDKVTFDNHNPLTTTDSIINLTYVEGDVTYKGKVLINVSHVHMFGAYVERKEPTCEEDGNVGYYQCTECNKYYEDNEGKKLIENIVIDKLGHNIVKQEFVDGTCKVDGVMDHYKCTNCNQVYSDKDGKYPLNKEDITAHSKHTHENRTYKNGVTYECNDCNKKIAQFRLDDRRIKKDKVADKTSNALGSLGWDKPTKASFNFTSSKAGKVDLSFELSESIAESIINQNDLFVISVNGVVQNNFGGVIKKYASNGYNNFHTYFISQIDVKEGLNTFELVYTISKTNGNGTNYNIRSMFFEGEGEYDFDECPICFKARSEQNPTYVDGHCECGMVNQFNLVNPFITTDGKVSLNDRGYDYIGGTNGVDQLITIYLNSDVSKKVKMYLSHNATAASYDVQLGKSWTVNVNNAADDIVSTSYKHNVKGSKNSISAVERGLDEGCRWYDFNYTLVGEIELVAGLNVIKIKGTKTEITNLYRVAFTNTENTNLVCVENKE